MNIRKRLLSFIICGVMAFSACPLTAFADDSGYTGGLCEHHREHNEECGYIEAAEESPCTHEHTDNCYRLVTDCVHEHTEECYLDGTLPTEGEEKEADNCAHVCGEESGCITKELDCNHEHNDECGYIPAKEGSPCGYWCEICAGETEESDKADATDEIEETDEIDKTEEIDETDETEESEKSFSPMSARTITPKELEGVGTKENPYKISTAKDLYRFAQEVNGGKYDACAILTDDIVLNKNVLDEDGSLNEEYIGNFIQWTPICKSTSERYRGTFDGQKHTISGLYINGAEGYIGLFGYIGNGATVKNVGIVDSYINGSESSLNVYVGAICGYNSGTITNCYNTGAVSGACTGGVCGQNMNNGKIENCYNTGAVSGTGTVIITSAGSRNYAGGVCGNNSSIVTNCYNTGTVSSTGIVSGSGLYAGGVCGWNMNTGKIDRCYNTGTVSGRNAGDINYVGGVCGENQDEIINCYNTGTVSSTGAYSGNYAGGVCGRNKNNGKIENCYNTGAVSSTGTVSGSGLYAGGVCGFSYGTVENCYYLYGTASYGVGGGTDTSTALTVEQMTGSAAKTYMAGLFETEGVWGIKEGISTMAAVEVALSYYPYLKVFGPDSAPIGQTESINIMDKEGDYFLIKTNEDLKDFAAIVNGTLSAKKQAAYEEVYTDLDFDKPITNINAKLTEDIVIQEGVLKANGSLNGDGSKFDQWTPIGVIRNSSYTGTFDGNGKTISGLYIDSKAEYIGLFGYIGSGATVKNVGIEDSYINISTDHSGGGVCGWNNGTVTNCYNTGTVSGSGFYVGGVCGNNNNGTITNCYNTGNISGSGLYAGGVCGYNSSTVTNCYNIGTVSSESIGGVCGFSDGTVENCYYLEGSANSGVGSDSGTLTDIEEKSQSQFSSGEVAWLLQNGQEDQEDQVWGQKIGKDELPRLSYNKDDKVCKVTFMNGGDEVKTVYINMGKTIEEPDIDVGKGFYVDGWYTDSDLDGDEWDFETDTIDDDITLYADVEERRSSGGGSYSLSEGIDRDEPKDEPEKQPEYRPDEPSTPETPGFIDVDIFDWYYDGVMYVTENGIMNGVGGNRFEPEAELKREMLAVILWNMTDNPEPNGIAPFLDVTSDKYYAEAIAWANENGVMYGYGEEFGVGEAVTREDFAAILYRYAAFKGYDTTQGGMAIREFIDFDQIADYAVEALGWAVNSGIISGMGYGTVSPKTSTYRGQAAVMLMKFCENIMK